MASPQRSEGRCNAERSSDEHVARPGTPRIAVHATILRMLVCTFGDLVLDVIVRLEKPFTPGDDTPATTHVAAGGQAANVAAWAAALGATARVVARRAEDGAGRLAAEELRARGVEIVGPVASGRGGVVVSVTGWSDERSMLSDRGVSPGLRAEEIDVGWLRGCDVFHLSGYALTAGPIAEAGAKAAGAARAQGARLSVDLASAAGIRAFGGERVASRLAELGPDVVFATESELAALGDGLSVAPVVVIKRGPHGVTVVRDGTPDDLAAHPADVVDPTGAGDALAAGFLVGGVELGLEAAARCVATVGAMP
jgi:ribokinase